MDEWAGIVPLLCRRMSQFCPGFRVLPVTPMSLVPGTRLGPYEIRGPLGSGGMGEVYRARDGRLGRDVAIKIVAEHRVDRGDAAARFEREWHVREDLAPFGQPVHLNINSFDTTATYGITSRVSFSGTVPFLHGQQSRFYADGARHEVSAGGLSDINGALRTWVWSPASHPNGNVQVGIGFKSSTGKHDVTDAYYGLPGTPSYPIDQSVQLGDGGWGVIFDTQAFRRVSMLGFIYGSGAYLASPKDTTELFQQPAGPYSVLRVSVPDVFSVKGGVGYIIWPKHGMTVTLGGRFDGIPTKDLFGESHGFRRPALIGFVDPSISITRGDSTFQIDAPVRVFYNFRRSEADVQLGRPGGGDLADSLLFIGYTRRFGGLRARP